jgi:formylglycine-generating enzyme required for sulfatase activity/flavodoxin
MVGKKNLKMFIGLVMTILLPLLMAYSLVGEEKHEWLGILMFALFATHQLMNAGWYKVFGKGRYTFKRTVNTGLNLLLFLDMIALLVSGIIMSRYVFVEMDLRRNMSLARTAHLLAAYWGFVLMSVHFGFHIHMTPVGEKIKTISAACTVLLKALPIAVAAYGAYAIIKRQLLAYMLLHIQFVFFDHDEPLIFFFADHLTIMFLFAYAGHIISGSLNKINLKQEVKKTNMKKLATIIFAVLLMMITVTGCGNAEKSSTAPVDSERATPPNTVAKLVNGMVLITGGTFTMGSPANEAEREADEVQRKITVSSFYIAPSEVTQRQYNAAMGVNPSENQGESLPVTNVTWLEALAYCNALSMAEGLTQVYTIDGANVTWNRHADGYRLPTEAEWEYAARAGTTTPFSFGSYVEDSNANCYNAYGYNNDASGNWVNGYLRHTININSYTPNGWGLYDMHGNAAEWVWDWYGEYNEESVSDPTGVSQGRYKIARGGGWNDFPKHIRSAYRSALPPDISLYSTGIRLVRNAAPVDGVVVSTNPAAGSGNKTLIAYFSASGNTEGLAKLIAKASGAKVFEIERAEPYRVLYADSLAEQRANAIPSLSNYLEDAGLNINDYDTILLGYPNWWASIPAPIRSFLTRYDLSGKTIIPFVSHGDGQLGQSMSAIAKLAPDSVLKKGLYVRYSSYDNNAIAAWLSANNIPVQQ